MNTLNDTQIPQSNTILFNGVPIEEIQNIKVSKNYCGSCIDLLGTDNYWAWKKQSLRQQ